MQHMGLKQQVCYGFDFGVFWFVLFFGPVCLHHSFNIRLWLLLGPHKGKPKPDILFYTENQGRLML